MGPDHVLRPQKKSSPTFWLWVRITLNSAADGKTATRAPWLGSRRARTA
jgi:hypothetical protein